MPSSLKAGISLGHPPHPESSNDSAAPSARGARALAAAPAISVNKPQQQYQRYQSRHQLQQPAQHSGGCGPSRGCFRFGQHRHYLSECRAVLPTPKMRFPNPYVGAQAAKYPYPGDYADFGSGPPSPSQSAPAPLDPHGLPVPSESSSSLFTNQATLAECKRCKGYYCTW